jgi:putative NADH-flavin reductase
MVSAIRQYPTCSMFRPITSFIVAALSLLANAAHGQNNEQQSLDILIYGATGKIGSLVVAEALDRGHHVTAVSRDPSQIEIVHPNLTAARGDLLDDASIASLAEGRDIIVVSVRGVIGDKLPKNALQRIAVERIVSVLRELAGPAPRLIHVGGAGSLEVDPGVLYADKLPRIFIPRNLELEIDGQILALEYLESVTDVAWTYATPAKNFTNGERTGEFRIGGNQMMEDRRGRSRISRADFAVALIDEAEAAEHVHEQFSVAY